MLQLIKKPESLHDLTDAQKIEFLLARDGINRIFSEWTTDFINRMKLGEEIKNLNYKAKNKRDIYKNEELAEKYLVRQLTGKLAYEKKLISVRAAKKALAAKYYKSGVATTKKAATSYACRLLEKYTKTPDLEEKDYSLIFTNDED